MQILNILKRIDIRIILVLIGLALVIYPLFDSLWNLGHALRNDSGLLRPAWTWVESTPGLRFLERFFIFCVLMALAGMYVFPDLARDALMLLVIFYGSLAASVTIVQSQATGAEAHSGFTMSIAYFVLIVFGGIVPIVAIATAVVWGRMPQKNRQAVIDILQADQRKPTTP